MADREDRAAIFRAALGEAVIEWNSLEKTLGLFLYRMLGGDARTDVLTSRLQASSLVPPMLALALTYPAPLGEHLATFARRFERLRGWRNHYVHGIMAVPFTVDGQPVGMIQDSAVKKGMLKEIQGSVPLSDLEIFIAQVTELKRYGGDIARHLWGMDDAPDLNTLPVPEPAPDLPAGTPSRWLQLRD